MSTRRPMRGLRRDQRSHLGPFRLVLEPLEARRLLAGIQVSVYLDQDGSRQFDATSDQAAPNRLVYVDLNSNGIRDAAEPIAITDLDGKAVFSELEPGDYAIGLLTNPELQSQVEPVGFALPKLVSSQSISGNFVASDDLEVVWSLNEDGVARLVAGSSQLPSSVSLGKIVAQGRLQSDQLLTIGAAEEGWRWGEFNLQTGAVDSGLLTGLPAPTAANSPTPQMIVRTQTQSVLLLDGPDGNLLARLTQLSNQYVVSPTRFTPAYAIASSPGLPHVAALATSADGTSRLTLLDPQHQFNEVASISFEDHATSVTVSGDGKFAYVSLSAGGVLAVAIGPSSLTMAAILHEAVGQVVANSSDRRIVTGSSRSPRELITWDTRLWLPIARSQLPTGNGSFSLPSLVVESRGERMLAVAGGQLHSIEMALPVPRRVRLTQPASLAEVRFGVRTQATSNPTVPQTLQREIDEDADDSFRLIDLLSDSSELTSNPLWFKLEVPTRHGTLESSGDGSWKYVPDPNYFGSDSAKLLVYDGEQATELVMQWNVAPTHDPPTAITAGDFSLLENAPHGTRLGPISVVDPDQEASFDIITSDERFQVYDGSLYFVAGELNYETEPEITFTITAVDFYSDFSVSTMVTVEIIDVNEKPFAIRLSGGRVPENEPGAVVGNLSIVDPDTNVEYAFYLFDSRFTISGSTLKLVDGVTLDFETEPVVNLTVAATDGTYEIFEVIKINVIDRDEGHVSASSVDLASRQLEELVPGASVGVVSVVNPKDSSYQFAVSDTRFEVVGDLLKLRENQHVTLKVDDPLTLTITASGDAGDQASGEFAITIIANQSPYHNSRIAEDVNGDGYVSPIDVLIVVNSLNQRGTFPVPTGGTATGEPPSEMPDVNGDGVVSPIDALIIINRINGSLRSDGSGEKGGDTGVKAEGESVWGASTLAAPALESDAQRRQRAHTTIDAELELLLDQLSRAQLS